MKVFRAISGKEQQALREKKDIFYEHQTCKVEDWILNPHPEDYQSGKFFFFTMEDAIFYAKDVYLKWHGDDHVTIMEMDIDEKFVLPYLGYGEYTYPDYNKSGELSNMCRHCISELLLPFSLIGDKIKNAEYNLINFDKDVINGEKNNDKFKMPYEKDRPASFVKMGNLLCDLINSRKNIGLHKTVLKNSDSEYHRSELEKEQKKYNEASAIFPQAYREFMECQRNYVWTDFRKPASPQSGEGNKSQVKKEEVEPPQMGEE